jgi:hypothetical protein
LEKTNVRSGSQDIGELREEVLVERELEKCEVVLQNSSVKVSDGACNLIRMQLRTFPPRVGGLFETMRSAVQMHPSLVLLGFFGTFAEKIRVCV